MSIEALKSELQALSDEERASIDKAVNELLVVYHSDDHMLIREKIESRN